MRIISIFVRDQVLLDAFTTSMVVGSAVPEEMEENWSEDDEMIVFRLPIPTPYPGICHSLHWL